MKKFFAVLFLFCMVTAAHAAVTVGGRVSAGYGMDFDESPKPVLGVSAYCEIPFLGGDYVDYRVGIRPEVASSFLYSPMVFRLPLVWSFSPNPYIDFGAAAGPMYSFFRGGFGVTADAFFAFKVGPGKAVLDVGADFPFLRKESLYLCATVSLGYQYMIRW
ncbi:MAG: hypothetical protein VZR56_01310 [Treponema sp.]|nr:hypothetical protein [Treponema sp.]